MLDVHPPHNPPPTWRDFLIHIATIVIGLLIAIGLEQTVEAIHHHHEREQFQQRMDATIETNLKLDQRDLRQLATMQAYLIELRAAIAARRSGKPLAVEPPRNDRRMGTEIRLASLAPYEAAQANGVVALLPGDQIGLYNRVALQRGILHDTLVVWYRDILMFEGFNERFVDSRGAYELGSIATNAELSRLSPSELTEELSLVAMLIKEDDVLIGRLQIFDQQFQQIHAGAKDESDVLVDDQSFDNDPLSNNRKPLAQP
jgi:hypothetical protein